METGCRRAILFLLFSPLFGTGFAQTETPVKVDKPLKSYSHWYFGAEYGVPFLFGDFTSFWYIRFAQMPLCLSTN